MKADDSSAGTAGALPDGFLPDEPQIHPQVTIRSQADVYLVYDIDPNQLPTETITRGGHRIFLDDTGGLHREPREKPVLL